MESSILTSIKKLLGIEEDYTHFDSDITMYINSAFMNLNQLGVGVIGGFKIEDASAEWDDFIDDERFDLEGVKIYIYLKTRLIFDPPQNSFLVEAIKEQIKELEWRLNVQVEGGS
jgi:hypothetical protein